MIALRDLLPRSPRPPCRHRHTADTAATTSTAAGSSPTPLPRLAPTSAPPTQHHQLLMVERRSPSHGERHPPARPVRQLWRPLPPPPLRLRGRTKVSPCFYDLCYRAPLIIWFCVYSLVLVNFENHRNVVNWRPRDCELHLRRRPPTVKHTANGMACLFPPLLFVFMSTY